MCTLSSILHTTTRLISSICVLYPVFCILLTGDAVTEYCHDCRSGICSQCLMDSHSDHNTADLLPLAELTREQLLRYRALHTPFIDSNQYLLYIILLKTSIFYSISLILKLYLIKRLINNYFS